MEMKFWAVLGSWDIREKNLPTAFSTVNLLDQLALTRLSAVADQSAPLCGTPFTWRTPCGASSVPTSNSRLRV